MGSRLSRPIYLPGYFKTNSSETTKTYLGFDNPNSPSVVQVGLKEYDKLVDEAARETSDLNVRYEKYAAAQAWLTDSSLFIPAMASSGAAPVLSMNCSIYWSFCANRL